MEDDNKMTLKVFMKTNIIDLQAFRRNMLMTFLKTKGEGEVSIMRKAFPKTSLLIKELQKDIEQATTGVFFAKIRHYFSNRRVDQAAFWKSTGTVCRSKNAFKSIH